MVISTNLGCVLGSYFLRKNKALKLRVFWGIFSVFLIQSRLHTITLQLDACVSKEDSEC